MRVFLAAYLAAVVILGALAVGGGLALYSRLGPDGASEEAASEHGYNLVGWEIKHFPEKWLHKLQHLFGGPSEQDRNDAICAYFQAAAKLNSTQEPDPDAEKRLAELENDVEDTIEGRVTAVLKDQKLTLEPPLFSDLGLVFPPVDFDIGGKELARLYFERYGTLEQACGAQPAPAATPPPTPSGFDFTGEMRALRREVEAMLAQGQVEQAEALMAAKRDEFQSKGIFIRRLNQAYFAFHGFYADSPGSIDPIGPELQTLLERAGSPGEFVRRASSLTTRADLDAALQ